MKLLHISVCARDAEGLATFYGEALGCIPRRPRRVLAGERVWRGNGLPDVEISSVWLGLPGRDAPFLEILEYSVTAEGRQAAVNAPGYNHLSFAVADIHATCASILRAGGQIQGEITDFGTEGAPHLIVYMRDSEGNLLELEQPPA
ncbi:MAG: VOC family protein [Pararhodobacter sp.]